MPFTCPYCNGKFCADHRLPETHNCPYAPKTPPPYVKAALETMGKKQKQEIRVPITVHSSKRKSRRWPKRKILSLLGIVTVPLLYITLIHYFSQFYSILIHLPSFIQTIAGIAMFLFFLSGAHELLHALAWWYYGYSAIPIPIPIPPILGITIGQKPTNKKENIIISLAPSLLTIVCIIYWWLYKDESVLVLGLLNLLGMGYDFMSALFC